MDKQPEDGSLVEEGGSLVEWVNEEALGGQSRRAGSPSDENRNLEPFARVGKDFYKLIPEKSLSGKVITEETLPYEALSPAAVSTILGLVPTDPEPIYAYGSFHVSTAVVTSIAASGTWYKVAGTTTAGNLLNFTMPQNGRLTYTGTVNAVVRAQVELAFYNNNASGTGTLVIAKNGVTSGVQPSTISAQTFGAGVWHQRSNSGIFLMAPDDYLELWVRNNAIADVGAPQMQFNAIAWPVP